MASPELQPNYSDFDMEVFAHNEFEALHAWNDCPIEEVAYLRNDHRHVFHIDSYKIVDHDDREQEFIILKHRVAEWLEEEYPDHHLGSTSCEMLAIRLIGAFGLSRCVVSEDGENGADVRPKGVIWKQVTDFKSTSRPQ